MRWLAARGHALSIVAAASADDPATRERPWQARDEGGLRVSRCPLVASSPAHGFGRAVRHVSFALASAPLLFREAAAFRPDLVAAMAPSAAAASAALGTARIAGAKAWLHLDEDTGQLGLEPAFDGVSLGAIDAGPLLGALGVDEAARLALLPWVDTLMPAGDDAVRRLRAEMGLAADAVVALAVGTCDDPRHADAVIAAARDVPLHGAIHFVVCGRGPAVARWPKRRRRCRALILRRWPPEGGLAALLAAADILLMPEGIAARDRLLPAKIGTLLAAGRPVVAPGDGVPPFLADAVVAATGAGLAGAVVRLAAAPDERLARGIAARRAAQDYFDQERVLRQLERGLIALAGG